LPDDLIIVRQIDVGRRIRLPCFGGGMTDDKEYLATIFDLLIDGYNAGRYGPAVSPARIAVRRARRAGGRHKWTFPVAPIVSAKQCLEAAGANEIDPSSGTAVEVIL
jgi:hypothetical protein